MTLEKPVLLFVCMYRMCTFLAVRRPGWLVCCVHHSLCQVFFNGDSVAARLWLCAVGYNADDAKAEALLVFCVEEQSWCEVSQATLSSSHNLLLLLQWGMFYIFSSRSLMRRLAWGCNKQSVTNNYTICMYFRVPSAIFVDCLSIYNLSIAKSKQSRMRRWSWMVSTYGFGRWSWFTLRHYPCTFIERLRKICQVSR
jgi:hypothetical protein